MTQIILELLKTTTKFQKELYIGGTHDNENNQPSQTIYEKKIISAKIKWNFKCCTVSARISTKIANEGYFYVYVPYGNDWFAYFMRRLAERPQNLSLAIKEFTKPKILKRQPCIGIFATLLTSLILGIKRHKNKKRLGHNS